MFCVCWDKPFLPSLIDKYTFLLVIGTFSISCQWCMMHFTIIIVNDNACGRSCDSSLCQENETGNHSLLELYSSSFCGGRMKKIYLLSLWSGRLKKFYFPSKKDGRVKKPFNALSHLIRHINCIYFI